MKRFLHILYVVFIGFLLSNSSLSFAQSNSKEEYKQITLEKAISIVTQKYQVSFSFSSDLINLQRKLNLYTYQKNITEVLDQMAEQANLEYKINGKQVILGPRKREKSADAKKLYIHGYVRDLNTKEILPDILIFCSNNKSSVYTNMYGYYSIGVPSNADSIELQAHILGYKYDRKKIIIDGKTLVNWDLESSIKLEAVEVEDQRAEDKAFHKSIISDNIDEDIRALTPRLLGEKDALAATRYYAGVNKETDISNGYNIRGGRPDQNLIMLDDAPLYHSYHLFGLYSIFNEDALKQMNLIKSGFPARYGGRLSSVVEMITKDGDMQKYRTEIGAGIIASRISLEGPIVKDKLAFFVSGRSSHIKTIFDIVGDSVDLNYRFYDLNTKLQWKLNDKHRLFVSFYKGRDDFKNLKDAEAAFINTSFSWGNESATLRWNHIINSKWFANASIIYSNYQFLNDNSDSLYTMRFLSGVKDYSLKYDIDYFLNNRHHLKFGATAIFHEFTPSRAASLLTPISPSEIELYRNEEFAVYMEDEMNFSDKISANVGLRVSGYKYKNTLVFNPEPRALITYIFAKNYALKASYGRMFQYSHYLNAFAGVGLPTDLWLPSTDKLLPEQSDQFSLGIYYNNKKYLKFNVEGFYKYQKNIINYSTNSSLLSSLFNSEETQSDSWTDRTMSGLAEMYGIETQIEYHTKKYKALIAYTLSYSKNFFDELGYGKWFWANNDRRHNFSVMNSYFITKNWSLVATWIYTTGTPFTLPESSYYLQGHEPGYISGGGMFGYAPIMAYDYKGINNYRMSSYHRLDVNINYNVKFKRTEFELQAGAMNVYNRRNTLYYTIGYNENTYQNELKRTAFLGIMPTLTLNFKF